MHPLKATPLISPDIRCTETCKILQNCPPQFREITPLTRLIFSLQKGWFFKKFGGGDYIHIFIYYQVLYNICHTCSFIALHRSMYGQARESQERMWSMNFFSPLIEFWVMAHWIWINFFLYYWTHPWQWTKNKSIMDD